MTQEYTVSHQRGIAGVNEQEIERVTVEAETPEAAIYLASGWPGGANPEATQGGSGRYNDYWMIEETRQGADFADVLESSAHIVADGAVLRASVPAQYSDDPDASGDIVVSVYPEPVKRARKEDETTMRLGTFHTPPRNQGQIVEISYTQVDGQVIRRVHDQSDRTTHYAISQALADDEGDYWNREPRNNRWRKISAEDVDEIISA